MRKNLSVIDGKFLPSPQKIKRRIQLINIYSMSYETTDLMPLGSQVGMESLSQTRLQKKNHISEGLTEPVKLYWAADGFCREARRLRSVAPRWQPAYGEYCSRTMISAAPGRISPLAIESPTKWWYIRDPPWPITVRSAGARYFLSDFSAKTTNWPRQIVPNIALQKLLGRLQVAFILLLTARTLRLAAYLREHILCGHW